MKKLLIIRYTGDIGSPFTEDLVKRIKTELNQDLVLTLYEFHPKHDINYPFFDFIEVKNELNE